MRRLFDGLLGVALLVACDSRSAEQAGHFTIRTRREDAFGHSSTRISLVYRGRTLATAMSDWSVDPRKP